MVDDVGDDHLHDPRREAAECSMRDARLSRYFTEQAIDVGFASTPNNPQVNRAVCLNDANGVEAKAMHAH